METETVPLVLPDVQEEMKIENGGSEDAKDEVEQPEAAKELTNGSNGNHDTGSRVLHQPLIQRALAISEQFWPFLNSSGQFHKTLRIRKLRIYSYGQILIVHLLIACKISVIYGTMAVNSEEKRFMEKAYLQFDWFGFSNFTV